MADWHGIKGMWVDRMLDPCWDFQCPTHPWPWPWIFKVKFWKCCISGIGGPIDMERKRCESIWCYTHFVTFNFDLNHDLDFEFSKSNFEKVVSGMGWPIHMEAKGCESIECWTHVVTFNITLTRDLRVKMWKCCISGMARPIDMEGKGCKSIGYRNWYQDWGHCGVTNDLGTHHSPRAKPEGCGELLRSLVTPQWPKSRYQFLFYHDVE